MIELDKIYCEDCLEGMKRIADGAVDCIISDLPYGTTACSWDAVIPFEPLWEQFKRVTKPNAAIVLFGSEPFTSQVRMSNIDWYKYDWVWEKPEGANFQLVKYQPLKVHETISVFSKATHLYNPQGLNRATIVKSNSNKGGRLGHVASEKHRNEYIQEYTNYPRSVLRFDYDPKRKHPTQKPVDLLRYLILTYTNVGGGSSRCNDRQRHDCCGGSDGKAPLHRLRDQQRVFRHRTGSHRRNPTQPDAVLKSDKSTE